MKKLLFLLLIIIFTFSINLNASATNVQNINSMSFEKNTSDDDNNPFGSIVSPREIRDYENATLIMDYRYATTTSNITNISHTICCNGEQFVEGHTLIAQSSCIDVCNVCSYQSTHHNYEYEWINYMRHSAECDCGDSRIEMHITSGVPVSPGSPYSECMLCGGLAMVTINAPLQLSIINLDNNIKNISSYLIPLSFIKKGDIVC